MSDYPMMPGLSARLRNPFQSREASVTQGQEARELPLEAPMFSPDDLLGAGLISKAGLVTAALMGGIKSVGKNVAKEAPRKMGQFGQLGKNNPSHVIDAMERINAKRALTGVNVSPTPDSRGMYAITVDGVPISYEKTLDEARNALPHVDADFWRGELKNF